MPTTKIQPWKSFPRTLGEDAAKQTREEMDLQRSYGTHASNTKGRIFTIDDKAQPWKRDWPAAGVETEALSEEELNMQRSYGTHASNTKGRLFTFENKPSEWQQINSRVLPSADSESKPTERQRRRDITANVWRIWKLVITTLLVMKLKV